MEPDCLDLELIDSRGKKLGTIQCRPNATIRHVRVDVQRITGILPVRQRLCYRDTATPEQVVLQNNRRLDDYHLTNGAKITVKQLGPQLTVFYSNLLEYVPPLVIYSVLYFNLLGLPVLSTERTFEQETAFKCWTIHFSKRVLETILVHEFGDRTIPVAKSAMNCLYYWTFSLLIGLSGSVQAAKYYHPLFVVTMFFLWGVSEIGNLICHLQLKFLRVPGTNDKKIPTGFLFEFLTKPNYFCEIASWFFFNVITGFSPAGMAFLSIGSIYMLSSAKKAHTEYLQLFHTYPRGRKIILPFVY